MLGYFSQGGSILTDHMPDFLMSAMGRKQPFQHSSFPRKREPSLLGLMRSERAFEFLFALGSRFRGNDEGGCSERFGGGQPYAPTGLRMSSKVAS